MEKSETNLESVKEASCATGSLFPQMKIRPGKKIFRVFYRKKAAAAIENIAATAFCLSRNPGLNRGPTHYECVALPTELIRPTIICCLGEVRIVICSPSSATLPFYRLFQKYASTFWIKFQISKHIIQHGLWINIINRIRSLAYIPGFS